MDKKLLEALNNLSDALGEIAEALKDSKDGKKSATTEALQGGNFSEGLKQINLGIQSIKKDTQEILNQQKTILAISKKKENDKKTGLFEKAGGDKKSEGNLKKGIGVILLIAIAVLAIGMAFKIVGKVDFVSVIALSLALVIISVAFEKIGKTMAVISMKDAYHTVIVMVLLAVAIAATSWILGMVKPIGIAQLVTSALIAGMFAIMSSKLEPLFLAVAVFKKTRVKAMDLLKTMVAISAGIAASSWILSFVKPIGFAQAITAILIAGMFAVISYHFERLAAGVVAMKRFRISKMDIVLTLSAIAAGITASSWILALVNPISFAQAITAILIAVMFAVISFNMHKIAMGVVAFKAARVKATDLLLVLVGIAAAITVSSWILSLVTPISFYTFLTALGIAILFALMSYVMPELAIGVAIMDKTIGAKKMLAVVPLVLVAISVAIMLSSHILAETKEMDLMFLIKLLAFGVILAIVVLAMMPSVLLVGIAAASGVGAGAILLGAAMIPVIALAVMVSSHILSEGKYNKYPGIGWALGVGATMLGFSLAMIELGIIASTGVGAVALLLGAGMVLVVAQTIVETSKIIGKGKYDKYPGLGWILSVGVTMTGFGTAVVALGILAMTGIGALAILAGAKLVPLIAKTIVETDKIISKGKYNKYPGLGWILSVGATMTGFGAAVVALGILSITGLGLGALAIIAGTKMVPKIAQTIVETDKIIATGKYTKYPGLGWVLSVGATMTGFGAAVVGLGILSITGFGLGALAIIAGTKMVPKIAQTIVDTDRIIAKGKYDKYPGWEWALSVGGLMTGFGLAVVTLGTFVVGTFGLGGLAIKAGAKAVSTIAQSIVNAAWIFKGAEGAFTGGPKKEWAEGVSLALGAFSPIYGMLLKGGIMKAIFGSSVSPDDYASAIRTISQGVVDAGMFFGSPEANVAFSGGPKKEWSEGVGLAIGAFAPVYKMLVTGGIMEIFTGKGPSIEGYVSAIETISRGIISAANIFSDSKVTYDKGTYPSVEWGQGVGSALAAFAPVFKGLEGAGWFQSAEDKIGEMIYGIKMMSYAIVDVGRIFAWSKLKFDANSVPGQIWSYKVKNAVESYIGLSKFMEDNDYIAGVSSVGVLLTARSLVNFAKEIKRGSGAFQVKIDPNYMKNMSSNIFYYMSIANKLNKDNSIGKLLKNAVFGDPISNIASSMMKLAVAYDKMGASLMRFNRSVNQLDEKKIKIFKGLNNNMINRGEKGLGDSVSGALSQVVSGAGNLVGGVLGSLTSLVSTKGDKKSPAPKKEKELRGKYGNINQQMDKLIDVVKILSENTKSLDKFIQEKLNEEKD